MLEKWIVFIVVIGPFIIYEFRHKAWRQRGTKLTYTLIVCCAFYLGADYLWRGKLPHFDELIDLIFGSLAEYMKTVLQI